jgi:hypothetical protein
MEGEDVFGCKVHLGQPQRVSPNISEQQTRINQSRSGLGKHGLSQLVIMNSVLYSTWAFKHALIMPDFCI